MRRDEVLRILREHRNQLRKQFGVKSLWLFGSVARDEAGPNSDIDLLVEVDRRISLFDLVDAGLFLERLLGVPKVDLVLSDQEDSASAKRYLENPHSRYQPRFDHPFFQQAFKELEYRVRR